MIIKCMFDKVRPTFTMLVGVPGSGKTTYALQLLAEDANIKYYSSDAIRKEIYGDEACQDDPNKVFTIMHDRTVEALKNGYDVIYDATNITRKNRKNILDRIPAYVQKECVVVWAPIKECIRRDAERERTVGEEVIMKMLYRFEAPFYDEGFDDIKVHVPDNFIDAADRYLEESLAALDIPHDNPHHTADVKKHCELCGDALMSRTDLPEIVKTAGYLHDIGKPLTKTFFNTKGEESEVAHYYGHQAVGAWISYGFIESDTITLAWLVCNHMAPFLNQKYHLYMHPLYKNWIDALHEADRGAH